MSCAPVGRANLDVARARGNAKRRGCGAGGNPRYLYGIVHEHVERLRVDHGIQHAQVGAGVFCVGLHAVMKDKDCEAGGDPPGFFS
jgi:hypothetical protein